MISKYTVQPRELSGLNVVNKTGESCFNVRRPNNFTRPVSQGIVTVNLIAELCRIPSSYDALSRQIGFWLHACFVSIQEQWQQMSLGVSCLILIKFALQKLEID